MTRFTARRSVVILTAAALLPAAAMASPAHAATRHRVAPGQSIQAAVDAAQPGDTVEVAPGVYAEQIEISTDGITLRGAGMGVGGTTITAPPTRADTACSAGDTFQDGICVTDASGVRITGIHVTGFPDGGITALQADELTVVGNHLSGNAFGLFVLFGSGLRLRENVISDNVDLGVFMLGARTANADVRGNELYGNRVGFVAANSSYGTIADNNVHDNCGGIALTNGGRGASHWTVQGNRVHDNSRACPADTPFPGLPAVSGSGISLQGVSDTVVQGNEVVNNQPAFDNRFAGGIEVHSTAASGGADPANILVKGNTLHGNVPDLRWDGSGTSITFKGNDCETSAPAGLCD